MNAWVVHMFTREHELRSRELLQLLYLLNPMLTMCVAPQIWIHWGYKENSCYHHQYGEPEQQYRIQFQAISMDPHHIKVCPQNI